MVRVKKDCVGILGLSKSGLGAAKLYSYLGFKVKGFDDNYNLVIPHQYKDYFSEVYLGKQPQYVINEIKNYRFLIISPGIHFDHPIIQYAKSVNVPVISEIEAAYRVLNKNKTIIGITGTNGKSTVTTLIYQFLKKILNNENVFIGGNIGYPFSEIVYDCKDIEDPIIVLELSSFQLKMTNNFRSQIAIITNISSDHLDRHITMQDYINSKLKLFYFQLKKDFAIFDPAQENITKNINYKKIRSSLNYFSIKEDVSNMKCNNCAFYKENKVYIGSKKRRRNMFVLDLSVLNNPLFKQEGIYLNNLLPSLLGTFIYLRQIRKEIEVSKIVEVLNNFIPLDYRLKAYGSWENIEFFSDSKATNLEATKCSIETVKNFFLSKGTKNFAIILLMGGIPKYSSKEEFWKELENLADSIKDNLIGVITFGKYSDAFINPFMKFPLKYMYAFDSLEVAFDKAISLACLEKQDFEKIAILLAPGGASFDQFNSAEERGKFFEKLIEDFLFSKERL